VIRQRGSHINLRHNRLKTGTLHGILSEVARMRSTTIESLTGLI
jgi:hypothetical protein